MDEEVWAEIKHFPGYLISNYGRVWNKKRERVMSTSLNNFGHVKISLFDEYGVRRTFFVARFVGEAFVEVPERRCNRIMLKDGDFANVVSDNVEWRPKWFIWRYYQQLKTPQHAYFQNLPVVNMRQRKEYDSVVDAGISNGEMFEDIWRSCSTGDRIYPSRSIYKVLN